MRIAQFSPPFADWSAATVARDRVGALARLGVDCRLFIISQGPSPDPDNPLFRYAEPFVDPESTVAALRQYDPDWTIAALGGSLPIPQQVALAKRSAPEARIILDCHASDPTYLRQFIQPDVLESTAAMIAPAPSWAWLLSQVVPPGFPIGVARIGADPRFASEPPPVSRPAKPIVLWVGRLDLVKNWRLMIDICARVSERIDVTFRILCDRSQLPELVREADSLIKSRGLRAHVQWPGTVPHREMPREYAAVAASGGCMLVTTLSEGFGLAIHEAMAGGCPVVAGAARSVVDAVRPGETGWLYPINNAEAAAEAIVGLVTGEIPRERITREATAFAANHTPEAGARDLLRLLGTPLESWPRPELPDYSRDQLVEQLRALWIQAAVLGTAVTQERDTVQWLHQEVAKRDETVAWLHGEVAQRDETVRWLHGEVAQRDASIRSLHGEIARRDATIGELVGESTSGDVQGH
ncbi:MAG: glycosyltransferase [Chloroflexota bacterium]